MKIAIVTNYDIGLWNFRKEIICALLAKGYEVHIILPMGEKVKCLIDLGCEFHPVLIDRRGMNVKKDCIYMVNIYRVLKNIKPDVVLTYTIKPNIYGGIVCRLLKYKYICNITGLGSTFQKGGIFYNFLNLLYKMSVKKANWIFIQNSEIYKILIQRKLISSNCEIIPGSGVSLEVYQFHEIQKCDDIHFLYMGRLMKEKGIYEFLEAATSITSEFDNVVFDIVGMKDENASLNDYLNDRIRYYGKTDSPKDWYKQCDCLINPSYHEGMSNVVLEACASGRPCLVSDIAGCKEIIDDGKEGYLFEPGNVDSLVIAIRKFISLDYDKRILMGENARRKVEMRFDRKNIVNTYMKKIEELEV